MYGPYRTRGKNVPLVCGGRIELVNPDLEPRWVVFLLLELEEWWTLPTPTPLDMSSIA